VSKNHATYSGGGIFSCCGFAPVTVKDTTFSYNTAVAGGGLFNLLDNATLTDSTVSGNAATLEGGGIVNNAGAVSCVSVVPARRRLFACPCDPGATWFPRVRPC
jgi:hypothetical protein